MKTRFPVLFGLAFGLIGTNVLAQTLPSNPSKVSYSFGVVNVPGASQTRITAVNDSGDVAGTYDVPSNFFQDFAFLVKDGVLTRFDAPPARPHITGINNSGVVVGYSLGAIAIPNTPIWVYENGTVAQIGFGSAEGINDKDEIVGHLFSAFEGFSYQDGVFTPVNVPGSTFTLPSAVNKSGDIAGSYNTDSGIQGFLEQRGHFTTISYPGANQTSVVAMNDKDVLVGSWFTPSTISNGAFEYQNGQFTNIVLPFGFPQPVAINNQGVIVGNFESLGIGARPHGFVISNGNATEIEVPGAFFTQITAINNHGEIVGNFSDTTGAHGFTATPRNGP